MASGLKLGQLLARSNLVKPEMLSAAIDEHKRTGNRLSQVLIAKGAFKEEQLLKFLEQHYQVSGISLGTFRIPQEVIDLIPKEKAIKFLAMPVQKSGANLVVALAEPSNIEAIDNLRFLTRCKITPVLATENSIAVAIEKYYATQAVQELAREVEQAAVDDIEVVEEDKAIDSAARSDDGPIIRFVNAILQEAIAKKISDVHFEPYEKKYRVRFRSDGNLVEASSQPPTSAPAIASRLKIMAKLNIAERRKPQDGRIKIRLASGRDMDFRVSVMPTIWGEKVVLRLLDKSNLQLDMTKLGFEAEDLSVFKEAIHQPQGLVLITGPTGSGKTTTIYSALAELNQPDVNISTAEDPVEFNLEGINQVQMNPDIELTFANALRSFLRQDPDIILVGEIRDLETAEIAMKAASTGHLVVSTLHTNDAPQTITRLTEMGVPAYVVTSTVNLIVAQRLVGKVCESCKVPIEVDPKILLEIGVVPAEVRDYSLKKGRGCNICNNTGIKGRIAIFEIMRMSDAIKECVLKGGTSFDVLKIARQQGMRTLRRSALLKLKRGETTIEEVVTTSAKDFE
jgi:type IV pilus assembly protein PilB